MGFDRLDIEGQDSGVGKLYWLDLRLIRESKGIEMRTVHERTRVPIEILSSFEEEGLTDKRRFNNVYRRSLAAAYARAIDIDPDDVLRSAEETELGRYRGRLARDYLGVQLPAVNPGGANGREQRDDPSDDSTDEDLSTERESASRWWTEPGPFSVSLSGRSVHVIAWFITALLVIWIVVSLV